jgi:uncharacterized protein YqgQ
MCCVQVGAAVRLLKNSRLQRIDKKNLLVKNTYLSNQASKPKPDFTIMFVSGKPLQKDLTSVYFDHIFYKEILLKAKHILE